MPACAVSPPKRWENWAMTGPRNPLFEALPDWNANPQIGAALQKLGWAPTTGNERVYFWVCTAAGPNLHTYWEKTKRVLLADVQSGNPRKIENAVNTFVALGNDEIIPELISILKTKGSRDMAQAYLNSGESRLGEAARASASAHGYQLSTDPVGNQPIWGQW